MPISDPPRPTTIRLATVADAPVLAHHRCAMFRDMGQLADEVVAPLLATSVAYFVDALPAGDYVAWLVAPTHAPEQIVAGGGLQLRRPLPRPAAGGGLQRPGLQGLIVNVYTEAAWRRQGLAALVMATILAWCRAHGVVSVVLHASPQGRPLYERLGFVPTNEMAYSGDLTPDASAMLHVVE